MKNLLAIGMTLIFLNISTAVIAGYRVKIDF